MRTWGYNAHGELGDGGTGLGTYRWVVERTFDWPHCFRRLRIRWERRADIHEAFLKLACCLITRRQLDSLCWPLLEVVSTGLIIKLAVVIAWVGRLVPDGLSSWPRRAVPGGNFRRSSVRPGRPRTAGSPSGAGPGCGASSTAWSWTNSAPAGSRTGRGLNRDLRREHSRQPGPRTPRVRHPAHPLPPRTASTTPRQTPWRQGIRPRAAVAAFPEHHPVHRPQRHRALPVPGPPPLDRGEDGGLACRLPSSAPALRAQG